MAHIENLLLNDEVVVKKAIISRRYYFREMLIGLISGVIIIIFGIISIIYVESMDFLFKYNLTIDDRSEFLIYCALIILIGVLSLLHSLIVHLRYNNSDLAITNKRLIYCGGISGDKINSLDLQKIISTTVKTLPSFFDENKCGYIYSFIDETRSSRIKRSLSNGYIYIDDPYEFDDCLKKQIAISKEMGNVKESEKILETSKHVKAGDDSQDHVRDLTSQLKELKSLLDSGAITEQEFNELKSKLLN
jgi:hypothetical protein